MSISAIATTIYNQIGKRTFFMLGAKNIGAGENYLQFQIRGSKKYTHIKIELNGKDLYDMTFYKCGKFEIKNQTTFNDVHVEDLHQFIESETGLVTKL